MILVPDWLEKGLSRTWPLREISGLEPKSSYMLLMRNRKFFGWSINFSHLLGLPAPPLKPQFIVAINLFLHV